ncbi:hypothetical protein Nepgr_030793 [Nepenthes gracilis]|uniref:Receptor-like serine/threonine-protein kinase n=1 Tax=Nepenthes gracilis TaxID=150966 RepID=A0AAD3Y656_NEPGR|nr:hypothetical protein Nepgr_030793 [Nepenthes gracilis]
MGNFLFIYITHLPTSVAATMAAETSVCQEIPSIIMLFLLCLSSTAVEPRSSLSRGSHLSVEDASDVLTSQDNTFTCGFYNVKGANAYWFAIWYTHSMEKTTVWMANREKPVNDRGSRLTLRRDGAMVLTDVDGSTAWQTNPTSTEVDSADLLNSGNLVLRDRNGKILWQSFDYPTDTLLPNQTFTNSKQLTTGIGKYMFGSGYFSLFFDENNVLTLTYRGPEISSIYWPSPDCSTIFECGRTNYNSSRVAVLDDMGKFVSSDGLQFGASDMGVGIKGLLKMDFDGNLTLYSLNVSTGLWVVTWEALIKLCNVHGLCGRNGVCEYTPSPRCSCPPHFEPTDSTDWGKGCKPKFERTCKDSHFVELTHVDYYGFDINYTQAISLQQCRQLCLGDCRCQAFSYRLDGKGWCYTKSSLFNGYKSPAFLGNLYLRLPKEIQTTEPTNLNASGHVCSINMINTTEILPSYHTNNQRSTFVFLYSFALAIGAFEIPILVLGWWLLFRKQGVPDLVEDGYRTISSQFRNFSYAELKGATRKFKEVLGSGGFGVVYKGTLEDARVVAVKRLGDEVIQGEEGFWAEVSTIGKINHMNLVRMWGFCWEAKHRLLVYKFLENGSLDKHLFSTSFLGWKDRFRVAYGTARGLAYLHHECLEWVIHCDIKPENILLDNKYEPKISDFGLAKLSQRGVTGSQVSRIRGTKGYMAPEWAMNLPITAKVDVYSYGVVILELVKGIRLSDWAVNDSGEPESELNRFVSLARGRFRKGEKSWVDEIVDPRLRGNFSRNQAASIIEVGISCVEEDRNKRPTMESVAQVLLACEDETAICAPENK